MPRGERCAGVMSAMASALRMVSNADESLVFFGLDACSDARSRAFGETCSAARAGDVKR